MVGILFERRGSFKRLCFMTLLIFSAISAFASGRKDSSAVTQNQSAESAGTTESSSDSTQPATSSAEADATPVVQEATSILDGETVTLAKIDQLIKQTKYSEALALIAEYIKLHPDNFDAAKVRIDRIMSTRNNYNNVENNLIDLAANEPDQVDKNYQMVLKLEKIEQDPSVIHETIRNEIKNLTQFKACQKRFNEILAAAMVDVSENKYAEAAEEFRSTSGGKQTAFEVYQQDFIAERYPRTITQPVDEALLAVDTAITEFGTVQKELKDAYDAFMSAVQNHDYGSAQAAYPAVQNAFTKLAGIRNNAAKAGWQLETVFQQLKKKNSELTDASYLPFTSKFILGLEKENTSGILGAMDTEWNKYVTAMKDAVYQEALLNSEKFASLSPVKNLFDFPAAHVDARTALVDAQQYTALGTRVNSLNALLVDKNGNTLRSKYAQYDNSMAYLSRLTTESATLLDEVRDVAARQHEIQSLKEPVDSAATLRSTKQEYVNALVDAAKIFVMHGRNATTAKNAKWLEEFAPQTQAYQQTTPTATSDVSGQQNQLGTSNNAYHYDKAYTAYIAACNELERQAADSANQMWFLTASFYAKGGTNIASENSDAYAKINNLLPQKSDAARTNDVAESDARQYPVECLAQLETFQKTLAQDRKTLGDCRTTLDGGKVFNDSFAPQKTQLDQAIEKLDSLSQSSVALADRARAQQRNARLASAEADSRYQQARTALAKNDFDSARTYLQQSRQKYNESLDLQENTELRKTSDANLVALGEEISKTENEVVVRDVRKLKNDAKDAYYAGNFDQAETLVARAETRWAVTNVDTKDEELESLKVLVNTALSMKTGRVIPPSAPLYPEMSQILSIANQYYNDGQKLIKQGKKTEAAEILNKAKQKLNELKLVYPLNQEASLLTLRIDQLLDKDAFNASFQQKVNSARINFKSTDANTKQQAYSDLKDLYEINPSYPGLKELIYNVEVELGFIKKPVDNSTEKQAATLASQAKRLLASAGNDVDKLQQAKNRALQALNIDQNNTTAQSVFDEASLRIGGTAAVVLSAADEALYQKAVQELQRNNIIAANTIVEQLLAKPSNKRSAKILELQKKVQALL